MNIYTKTGDQGTTSLVGGSRVSKDDMRIEAYGTIDELMAYVAYLRDNMADQIDLNDYVNDLATILEHLMRLSAIMACEPEATKQVPSFEGSFVTFLEERIDYLQSTLPQIYKFTIPGGHPLVSLSHICRTICRRAERRAITLAQKEEVGELLLQYVNRLSDYLYVLGRKLSDEFNVKETLWMGNK